MAEIDSLEIKITANAEKANTAIRHLTRSLSTLSTSLNFDTTSLEKLGKINGNNFKKLSEGLQSFANAAKSLQNVESNNFKKLSDGLTKIASIDSSKLEALGKIDGNSFRGLGEGVKALSAGLKDLKGVSTKKFETLATGIERLGAIQVGNMQTVSSALTPLADGIRTLSSAKFDNRNLQNLINSLTRFSNANVGSLANVDFATLGNKIKELATALSGADKVEQNTISMTNAIAKLAGAGANIGTVTTELPKLGEALKRVINDLKDAPKLEQETITFTQAIGQLANAGNRVETTANSLKKLGEELKKFLDLMSGVQTINKNTIKMVQALADLANVGGKAENSIKNLTSGTTALNVKTTKLTTSLKTLSKQLLNAMGVYVGLYGVIRGLKNAISSSMDYIEVLNYFNAAFGQVAENADYSKFEEMGDKAGKEAAEAYYNSFAQRAQELTAKMSGFTVGESGLLQSTGEASLGLDPSELMNYQAMFAQMSSSMGVSSETALKLSQALTEIGADLASVKNMDFNKVWEDMASGLAGMSRTLDKYGANIRNVNLQQKLNELGIEANITKLNQNDKALLRTIILLDSTKYAWGDLANTINQPANQLRLIQANFQNLSRTIGNLFLPIVKTVLPYINGMVIALQRLFSWIGNLLGVNLSGISSAVKSVDIGDIIEDTDDLAGGLEDAKDEADKLNKSIRAFDELKTISMPDDSGNKKDTGVGNFDSGLLDTAFEDAFSEYQKTWDEAFAGLENRAQEIANSIEKAFEPIKKIIQDFAVGDFFQAGKDVSSLVISITDFFARAIDNVDWYAIGVKIGDFLRGIDWFSILAHVANLIWQALKAGLEAWSGMLSSAPIETALISIFAGPKILKAISSSKLITGLKKIITGVGLVTKAFGGNMTALKALTTQYPKFGKVVNVALQAFAEFKSGLNSKGLFTGLKNGLSTIRNSLSKLQKGAITAVAGFAEFKIVSNTFKGLIDGSEDTATGILKIVGAVAAAGAALSLAFPAPIAIAVTAAVGLVAAISGITTAQEEMAKKLAENREIEVFGDTVANITAKMDENIEALRKRGEGIMEYVENAGLAETMFAQDLAERYFNLAEKEELTNDQKQQMQTLAKELVNTLPGLQEYYDTETGLLDTTRENVDNLIESRLKEIQLNAIEEKLTEEYKRRVDALGQMNDAAIATQQAQNDINAKQTEYNDLVKKSEALEEYEDLKDKIWVAGDATDELKAKQEELENILTDNGATEIPTIDSLKNSMADAQEEIVHMQKKWKGFVEKLEEYENEYEDINTNITNLSGMMVSTSENAGLDSVDSYSEAVLSKVEEAKNATKTVGDNAVAGYEESIDKGIRSTERVTQSWLGSSIKAGMIALEEHSPSKAMKRLGEYAVEGYNIGIGSSESKRSTTNIISSYVGNILGEFSKVIDPLKRIGVDAMKGLNSGLESMEDSIYVKAGNIAGNVAKTVMDSLEIHSPSRVMFRLGDYTMQGFQNGLENLYQPILSSVKGFSKDLQYTPEPNLSDIYINHQYSPTPYMTQYNNSGYQNNGYVQNNTETNVLLRRQNELLEALLNKPTLNNGDIFNAARTVYKGEAMRRYGNSEAFDPVWG